MKTRQEVLREGMKAALLDARTGGYLGEYFDADEATELQMQRLSEQGLVFKVERELPEEGLYLPGGFRHPNWLQQHEFKAIIDLATEPVVDIGKIPGTEPTFKEA